MSLDDAKKRWIEKYGHLSEEEKEALIKRELEEALRALEARGVKPVLGAEGPLKITREK